MGAVCDPCSRAGRTTPLPPEFFAAAPVRAALAAYEFGVFFRQVRRCMNWSQRTLGEVLDMPVATSPWAAWACVDGLRVSAWQGHAYYELARRSGHPRLRDQAVTLLAQALDNPRPISRALYLPDVAGAHAPAGDVDTAVALGHQAVDTITAMTSRRTYARLRVLHGVLEPLHASPGVADLRDRLATATAA